MHNQLKTNLINVWCVGDR